MGTQSRRTVWNEEKRQRTYSISDTCQGLVTGLAEANGMNRSEVIEVIVRWAVRESLDLIELRSLLAKMLNT
jgi:hypothetical protein